MAGWWGGVSRGVAYWSDGRGDERVFRREIISTPWM